jgi:HAD superfamily hydrolase (TIGR01509 family)
MRRRIEHVAFDLDGTLIDTRAQIVESILACIDPELHAEALPVVTSEAAGSPRALLSRFGVRSLSAYWRQHAGNAHLAKLYSSNTASILRTLHGRGVTTSIVTSLPARPANALLAHAGLSGLFSRVDTYGSYAVRKPSPDLLTQHLRELRVETEAAAYVGDTEGDMRMASAAGALALGAGWGGLSAEVLSAAGATKVLAGLDGVLGLDSPSR